MRTLGIFEDKQHYLTTVYRNRNRNARRVRIKSVDQLERLVEKYNLNAKIIGDTAKSDPTKIEAVS